MVEARALVGIPQDLARDAPDDAGAEIVRIIKTVYRTHHFLATEAGVFKVRQLMAVLVGGSLAGKKAFLSGEVVELGARKRVGERDLNCLAVELFGVIDRPLDGL